VNEWSDDVWALAALAGLSGMGPRRLRAVLFDQPALSAWQNIQRGRLDVHPSQHEVFRGRLASLRQSWAEEARRQAPEELVRRCRAHGVTVLPYGSPGYPETLLADADFPLILFVQGDLAALEWPTVAVVGTRRATPYGISAATDLGRELAECGVAVVSGLASGIDGAAHQGALRADAGAPPVGVVGTGLDIVYPRQHRALWHAVGERGALLSEAPPGTHPENWRFPARNRIIAALAQVLVVVESPARGGSMITVEEALSRQRPIAAVPGSIYSPASDGTNQLIFDGCTPSRSVSDVLGLLKLRPLADKLSQPEQPSDNQRRNNVETAVLDAIGWEPAAIDEVALRSGLSLPQVITTIEQLVTQGELVRHSGLVHRISGQNRDVGRR
jgi:DNA processing protein